jgi:hypothetical protein
MHKAMLAGDVSRVTAYSLGGADRSAAWRDIRASEKPAKPAAKSTRKSAKGAAKPKAEPNKPAKALDSLAAKVAGMSEAEFVAFFNDLHSLRSKKSK